MITIFQRTKRLSASFGVRIKGGNLLFLAKFLLKILFLLLYLILKRIPLMFTNDIRQVFNKLWMC